MGVGRRVVAMAGIAGFVVLAVPSLAHAGVAITVPATSTSPGSVPSGTTSVSIQLGTVTVTTTGATASWTTTVVSTDFKVGAGASAPTIPKGSISYWSGGVTASSGLNVLRVPGQLTSVQAESLSGAIPVTAFRATVAALSSTSWNPTIVVAIPATAVAGTYTGTVTHSVA